MLTFKKFVKEDVKEPIQPWDSRSEGEQRFKHLHNPINHKNLVPGVTDQESLFNGNKRMEDPSTSSYENYRDDDESKEVYDNTLVRKAKVPEKDKDVKEEIAICPKCEHLPCQCEGDPKIVEEEAIAEITDKKAWDYVNANLKEPTADVTTDAGFRKNKNRGAGLKLALAKQNPPHKRLQAVKVPTSDAAAKEAKYQKAIAEKHLTPAEMKKREEIAKAIAKENPSMPMSKKMAISTSQAKKVAEETIMEAKWESGRTQRGQEKGDIHHVEVEPKILAKHGISHQTEHAGEYGQVHYFNHPKHGHVSVYQSDLNSETGNPIISVRTYGTENSPFVAHKFAKGLKGSILHTYSESLEDANKASKNAKDLENQGHDAQRVGDEKGMRRKFADMAMQKLKMKSAMNAVKKTNEAVEQINEIGDTPKGRAALGSYVKKASHDVATKSAATGRYAERANKEEDNRKKNKDYSGYRQGRKDNETADKMFNKSWKRRQGIAKAVDRLTKEAVDLDASNVNTAVKHDCATHVEHATWGKGNCLSEMHTIEKISEDVGYVTHYDVMFEHGIEQNVPVEDLKVLESMMHGHTPKKKKSMREALIGNQKKIDANHNGKVDGQDFKILRGKEKFKKFSKKNESVEVNMSQDSIDKIEKDPLASKVKIKLPPTQGNKAVGGDIQTHPNVAEQKLQNLYNSLSEENRAKFEALIETDPGFQQLLDFAEKQGF